MRTDGGSPEAFPSRKLVEIPDSYTLAPEDQPVVLAAQIREFVAAAYGQ